MVYLSWRLGKPPCTVHIFIPTILILALFRKKGRVFLRCRAKTGHARRVSAAPFPGGSPFLDSRYTVHTRRVSAAPFPGGSPFLGTLFMVQPSCGAIRPFRAGDFALCGARENGAPARGQKDRQPTVFHPLRKLPFSLWQPRERALRPYFVGNSHKGTVSVHVFRVAAA